MLLSLPITARAASVSDFYDISPSDWYYSAVSFVTDNGMFNGTGDNSFSPASTMTRGMFVTVLGRYSGVKLLSYSGDIGVITKSDVNMRSEPTTSGSTILACLKKNTTVEVYNQIDSMDNDGLIWYYVKYDGIMGYIRSDLMEAVINGFSDVADDAYYKPYVMWAVQSYVASATGSDTFSPDRDITREEICSMLYNFAALKNFQLKPVTDARSFSDSAKISSEYREAVSALQQVGVINGYDDGSFKPAGSATRAEVSAMLMRFVDAISYHPVKEPSLDSNGNYIFGTEVPQSAAVADDYFSDACFIGHSLIVGMRDYSGITNADFFAVNGASTQTILKYEGFPLRNPVTNSDGDSTSKGTLAQALDERDYGKVYIMLGVNEIGSAAYHRTTFRNNMSTLIDLVRKSQPNAKLYLISVTPVSKELSESHEDINRDNIIAYNNVIKQLCADKRAFYLNVFDLMADSNGYLPDDACMNDGLHILGTQYKLLKNYISTHTMQ